jgi:hypothetical protein
MCMGGKSSTPPAATAPAPPPPAPVDRPATPAFNENSTNSTNAANATDGARRGRKSLRVDLGVPSDGSPTGGAGLSIPTG